MTEFHNLQQDEQHRLTYPEMSRLLYPEIIRVVRLLGGRATRAQIREELKNSSRVIDVETITAEKDSPNRPGETFRPFDFPFYISIKDLVFTGYLRDEDRHTVALTDKGREVDMDSWNLTEEVFKPARAEWNRRAKRNKQLREANSENSAQPVETEAPVPTVEQAEGTGDTIEQTEMQLPESEDPETEFQSRLHNALMGLTPIRFEEFARELVKEMGVTIDPDLGIKATGDGGIDGFGYVTGDDFRTTRVAIQAKRWQGTVSSPEIDRFRGAMDKFNAEYGIFITTSDFSQDAVRASRSYTRMVTLINGEKIAELVRRYHLHAQEVTAWVLDDDFFHPDRV